MSSSSPALRRNLSARQLQLMALGSTIGVGLFLGSATAIELAGPSILLAYALSGVVTFIVLRALGEIAVYHPVSGSFAIYATTYAHPIVGFLVGWGYWAYWTIIAVAEVTAVGIYMQFWLPGSPQWQWALAAIVTIGGFNLLAARVFGELEFWFALIKIVTILALIALGTVVIVWGFPGDWKPLGLGNLVDHGGFFPNGLTGCLLAMQMVLYAYVGAEMIGLTAGEAENPERTLPRAINSFVWRIALFYVGAILVILAIFPWNRIAATGSPFVEVFERLGLAGAAGIVNFVVITAALSSCNGGVYASGRMLFSLASSRQAPRRLGRVSPEGVPRTAILFTVLVGMLGVAINYWAPQRAFEYLTAAVTFIGILIWLSILFTHARFRRRLGLEEVARLQFRMGFWPWSSLLATAFLVGVVVILLAGDETRLSSLMGLLLLAIIAPGYALARRAAAQDSASG
jgi:AAT family amino acid transporter